MTKNSIAKNNMAKKMTAHMDNRTVSDDMQSLHARSTHLLTLALPIMAALISQSIINLVDTAMVGRLGADALAGTGIGGYANFVSIAIIIGLSGGVQAVVSRRTGENADKNALTAPLNAGLFLAFYISLPLTLIYLLLAPYILPILSHDPNIAPIATEYFQARIIGLAAVAGNFCFRGFWNGINLSKIYMRTLIIMHLLNVVLSYGLIFGAFGLPELGAKGAGLGTSIAMFAGFALYLIQAIQRPECGKITLLSPSWPPNWTVIKNVAAVTLPSSIQQFVFALGLLLLFVILAHIGANEVAAAHILINLVLFIILPGIGMGLAAASLAGQALGAEKPQLAYQWGIDATRLTFALMLIMTLPMWLFPDLIMRIFSNDTAVLQLLRPVLILTGFTLCFDALALVFSNTLVGVGHAKAVMKITLFSQWLLFLPIATICATYFGFGLLPIWILYICQRLISTSLMTYTWHKRHWVHISL